MKSTSDIIRCFIALYPDSTALEEIAALIARLRELESSVRWERPPQVHITAQFIGDIARAAAQRITRNIAERLHDTPGIVASIDRLGAFPNLHRPRIVWLGFSSEQPALLAIQTQVAAACATEGVEPESRPFTPHFTIGRVKQHGAPPDLHGVRQSCSFNAVSVNFRAVRVMESTLTPSGAVHREIGRVDLV